MTAAHPRTTFQCECPWAGSTCTPLKQTNKQTDNKADQSLILTSTAYDCAVARIIAPRTNTNALPIMASLRPIQSTIKPAVGKKSKTYHKTTLKKSWIIR